MRLPSAEIVCGPGREGAAWLASTRAASIPFADSRNPFALPYRPGVPRALGRSYRWIGANRLIERGLRDMAAFCGRPQLPGGLEAGRDDRTRLQPGRPQFPSGRRLRVYKEETETALAAMGSAVAQTALPRDMERGPLIALGRAPVWVHGDVSAAMFWSEGASGSFHRLRGSSAIGTQHAISISRGRFSKPAVGRLSAVPLGWTLHVGHGAVAGRSGKNTGS